MAKKFHGTLDELKTVLAATTIRGEWVSDASGKHAFRSVTGGILNWWQTKGTLQYQGDAEARTALEHAVDKALTDSPAVAGLASAPTSPESTGQQIFIVHGHDKDARDQLELVLHRLHLEPYILMNTSGGGLTIIEALEGQIGREHTSDFGIVLMTPDDIGYAREDGESKAEPRARQNVVLETGMLISSLTRDRMTLIVKGHLEIPSDLQGVIRLGYNDHIREIVPKLCQRLGEAGFELDSKAISEASA